MHHTRRIIAAFSTALILGCGALIASSPDAFAATCSGWSCHGHDPTVYGCSASTTVSAAAKINGTQVATLQNRYAANCKVNWGRAELTSAGLSAHDSIIVDISTTDSQHDFEYMCYPVYGPDNNAGLLRESCSGTSYGGNLWIFSDMTDGTNTTTADVYVYNSSGTEIASASASQ